MIHQDTLDNFDLYSFLKESDSYPELRLGQFFINKYWQGTDDISRKMWNLDGEAAIIAIVQYLVTIQQGGIDY